MKKEALAEAIAVLDALAFYGRADTWWATMLLPDHPAGDINDDYSSVDGRLRPGKRARVALGWEEEE